MGWLRLSVSTQSGSEDRSCPPCPLSSRCGSRKVSMTSQVQQLCTASASDLDLLKFSRTWLRACRMDHSNVHAHKPGPRCTFVQPKPQNTSVLRQATSQFEDGCKVASQSA